HQAAQAGDERLGCAAWEDEILEGASSLGFSSRYAIAPPNWGMSGMRVHALFAFALMLVAVSSAQAQQSQQPSVFAGARQAQVAHGVHFDGFLTIGGIQQYVSVRGRHKDAPIILFLHGGPGFTSTPTSYVFMAPWEEYFTVAQYDQ